MLLEVSRQHAFRWAVVLVALWLVAVYGLPEVRRVIPSLCAYWNVREGFCGTAVQSALEALDGWSKRYLGALILPRDARVQAAVTEVQKRLRSVEETARAQVGDQPVDDALRGAEQALRALERTAAQAGTIGRKVADVPENLDALLAQVRSAFDRLRHILGTAGRSAEQVSGAFAETTKALDALSNFLPGQQSPSPTPSPS